MQSCLLRDERRAELRALESLERIRPRLREVAGEEGETVAQLADGLAELDPGQRDVTLLYAWEELS
jgi:hypothetical protein